MIDKITQSPYVNVLGQALRAASTRHSVISNNIANVNTPGFKKSEVVFEELLAAELSPPKNKLQLLRTQDSHLPMQGKKAGISPQINRIDTTTMRTDGNNVDVDVEMAELAKNNIYANANIRQISAYFSGIKSVIAGQK